MTCTTGAAAAGLLAVGIAIGGSLPWFAARPVHAVSATANDAFAVCTAPLNEDAEGFFILDFETGDLSGGVLGQQGNGLKFTRGYRRNVLPDLGFKPGKVKNPRFLLVSGIGPEAGPQVSRSVLYVTDVSTGVTVAYAIPLAAAAAGSIELVPLDVARPRGAPAKAP
jgi:hypothetical protein